MMINRIEFLNPDSSFIVGSNDKEISVNVIKGYQNHMHKISVAEARTLAQTLITMADQIENPQKEGE